MLEGSPRPRLLIDSTRDSSLSCARAMAAAADALSVDICGPEGAAVQTECPEFGRKVLFKPDTPYSIVIDNDWNKWVAVEVEVDGAKVSPSAMMVASDSHRKIKGFLVSREFGDVEPDGSGARSIDTTHAFVARKPEELGGAVDAKIGKIVVRFYRTRWIGGGFRSRGKKSKGAAAGEQRSAARAGVLKTQGGEAETATKEHRVKGKLCIKNKKYKKKPICVQEITICEQD